MLLYPLKLKCQSWYNPRITLQWRHNGRDSVSNYQPHNCLLNRLFRRRSKKTSKLCVTGLCARNSPGNGEFLAQMAQLRGKCFHLMTSSWQWAIITHPCTSIGYNHSSADSTAHRRFDQYKVSGFFHNVTSFWWLHGLSDVIISNLTRLKYFARFG